jgi:hypothetical protein
MSTPTITFVSGNKELELLGNEIQIREKIGDAATSQLIANFVLNQEHVANLILELQRLAKTQGA